MADDMIHIISQIKNYSYDRNFRAPEAMTCSPVLLSIIVICFLPKS